MATQRGALSNCAEQLAASAHPTQQQTFRRRQIADNEAT